MLTLAGCTAGNETAYPDLPGDSIDVSGTELQADTEPEVMCSIRITAGDTVLYGVLYDNQTAQDFAGMLPLTVDLWHPAPDFARAFDLPEYIPEYETPGRTYELGTLAYWSPGPSVAVVYKDSREETVVPVIPFGKITSDVSIFEEYGDSITIEFDEEP